MALRGKFFQKSSERNVRGFTLIEAAISLTILSIFIATGASLYGQYVKEQIRHTTIQNMDILASSLNDHLVLHGRYPCPAPVNAERTDASYGMEGTCTDTSTAVGTCSGGICVEESVNTVTISGVPTLVRVRRGMLPFRSMGIDESYALDGRNNRVQYAVTEILTSALTYSKGYGGITVRDEKGGIMADRVHYVIFSSGDDGAGAYSNYGKAVLPCNTAALDGENCNTGNTPATRKAYYALGANSTSSGAKHFDDRVKFYSSNVTPLWRVTDEEGVNIRDLVNAESGGRVAVGNSSPQATVDVSTSVKAQLDPISGTGGNVYLSERICNASGTDCFTVAEIAKPDSIKYNCDLKDPSKPFLKGFIGDQAECMSLSESLSGCTETGKLARGIDANGELICATATSCPAKVVNLCYLSGAYDTDTLPSTFAGQTVTTKTSGISYRQNWLCQSSGVWKNTSSSGVCSCTPEDYTYTGSCSTGFTGSITYRFVRTCPANTTSTTTISNTCTCTPTSQETTGTCPSGASSGSIKYSTPWVCTSASSGYWDTANRTVVSNTCKCDPQPPGTRTIACDPGYSGTVNQQRTWVCAGDGGGSWSGWTTVSSSCTCDSTAAQYQTASCPAGQIGTVNQRRLFDCTTQSWSDWETTGNTCSIVTYTWRMKTVTGSGSTPRSVQVNGTCTTQGQTAECSQPLSSGAGYQYGSCQCE